MHHALDPHSPATILPPTSATAHPVFVPIAAPPSPAPASSPGTVGHAGRITSPEDDSPRITGWLADGGLGAGPLRTVREVEDAAARAVELTGAGDVPGSTAFCAADGCVYRVRVAALVEVVEPEVARCLLASALTECPPEDEARRVALESHLHHITTCRADNTTGRVA